MKKRWLVLIFALLVLFIFVKADYDGGNPALVVNDVGPGQLLSGYLNMSFENESGDNIIRARIRDGIDIEKEMKLFDFMKNAEVLGVNFDCWYNGQKITPCSLVFEDVSSSESYIGSSGENYVGFILYGDSVNVVDLSFKIIGKGTSISGCGAIPFSLDLFYDGNIDYEYAYPSLSTCSSFYPEGFSYPSSDYDLISSSRYCETIYIPYKSGKAAIGGYLNLYNISHYSQSEDIIFSINKGSQEYTCNPLNVPTSRENFVESECDVDIFVEPGNYTVCVKTKSSVNNYYGIMKSNGVRGLFIKPYSTEAFNQIVIFNTSLYYKHNGRDLISDLNNFLNNADCSNGCLIPLYINSSEAFDLQDLSLIYDYVSGSDSGTTVTSKFYELSLIYPEIDTSGYAKIPLAAFNLTAPTIPDTYNLEVSYKSFSDDANFDVERVPIIAGIFPTEIVVNEPIEFRIIAYSPKGNNITSYRVDWGDGSSPESNADGIFIHTYTASGSYTVTITVTDSEYLETTSYFTINVGIPFTALNASIKDALNKLNNFENSLVDFYADWLKQQLNLQEVKQQLNNLSLQLLQLGPNANESDLALIKQQFDSIKGNIPIAFENFASYSALSYAVDWQRINIGNVEAATNDSCVYSQEECKKALGIWNFENVALSVSGEKKKIRFYDGHERIITIINIMASTSETGKLIVELSPLTIYSDSSYDDLGNAVAFDLQTISIAYDGDIEPYSLVIYATPSSLSDLPPVGEISGVPEIYEKKGSKLPLIFSILIMIILVVGLAIIWWPYINKILQAKKIERERKLFASRADYYNLFNFVTNALRAGQDEKGLRQKLLNVGWKKEQIDYVIKKAREMMKRKK